MEEGQNYARYGENRRKMGWETYKKNESEYKTRSSKQLRKYTTE